MENPTKLMQVMFKVMQALNILEENFATRSLTQPAFAEIFSFLLQISPYMDYVKLGCRGKETFHWHFEKQHRQSWPVFLHRKKEK